MFHDVPDGFPLQVSLKTRPVNYRLAVEMSDRVATIMLCLFWGLGVPAVLWAIADPFAPWIYPEATLSRAVALGALGLFVVFGIGRWLGPTLIAVLRRQDVQITETGISVAETLLGTTSSWTKPLSEFKGVARETWGTRSVGNEKIAIAAIVLVHADSRYSVPLAIDGALRLKEASARRKADQLGLPYLDGAAGQSGLEALPAGAIVVNQWPALKVRGLYALFTGGGLIAALAAIFAGASAGGGDPALFGLAALALAVGAAMHIFAGCYVTAMTARDGGDIDVRTAAALAGTFLLKRDAVRAVDYREGRSGAGTRHAVHTPWVKVRVDGRRLPLVVDMQSEFVDEAALITLATEPQKVRGSG